MFMKRGVIFVAAAFSYLSVVLAKCWAKQAHAARSAMALKLSGIRKSQPRTLRVKIRPSKIPCLRRLGFIFSRKPIDT